jgi:hypothetical protein
MSCSMQHKDLDMTRKSAPRRGGQAKNLFKAG